MLSKVIDWTAGSFFRTIGRLLVFVILGFIIANLFDFSDIISNFRINDLFFEKVNAEEIGTYVIGYDETYYKESALTNQYTIQNWYQYETLQTKTSLTQEDNLTNFYLDNHFNLTPYKGGYITIPFEMYLPIVRNTLNSTINGQDYCDRWDWGTLDSYNNVTRWNCARVDQTDSSTISDTEYVMPRYSMHVNIVYNTGYVDICSYNQSTHTISCPITNQLNDSWYIDFLQIYTKVFYSSTQTYNYYIYLHKKINAYSSAFNQVIEAQNQNTNAINSQTQQQQEQHAEIMDTNTTETESEASSFFEDFSVTDHGGLSSILTAPLTIFNSILNDTCVPATFTYRGKQVSLPCGQDFWNQAPNLRDWLSTLESGIIAYAILINLFKMIQKLESPSNSEVEVESL